MGQYFPLSTAFLWPFASQASSRWIQFFGVSGFGGAGAGSGFTGASSHRFRDWAYIWVMQAWERARAAASSWYSDR